MTQVGCQPVRYRDAAAGMLAVLHFTDLPFTPVRAYWLFDTPADTARGTHAHKLLEQFVVCVSGSVTVVVDDARSTQTYIMSSKSGGVHLPPGTWRTVNFEDSDSVLLVFASLAFDAGDYIFDYQEFLRFKGRA